MEIKEKETSVLDISGTKYVLIPADFAEYFKLKAGMKAKISDKSNREASIVFPE